MNGSALDIKDYVEQKDMINRFGRQDIIYVMLDKRIDHVREDVKELRDDVKELRTEVLGEIGKTNQRIDSLAAQTTQQLVSMKTWGIGLAVAIFLGIVGLAVPVIISLFR